MLKQEPVLYFIRIPRMTYLVLYNELSSLKKYNAKHKEKNMQSKLKIFNLKNSITRPYIYILYIFVLKKQKKSLHLSLQRNTNTQMIKK